jgi:hypothetical protein
MLHWLRTKVSYFNFRQSKCSVSIGI